MSAVLGSPTPPTDQRLMRRSLVDLLRQLGDIPLDRVRLYPPPGTATFDDLDYVNERSRPPCELIDGTLVEKAVGFYESWLGVIISGEMYAYLKVNDIGMLGGEAGVVRILPDQGRAADVAFYAWAQLPGNRPPPREDRIPAIVPALAVEVLSESNTRGEMARKRADYFRAGTRLVWEVDPVTRTAVVYTADDAGTPVPADGALDGRDVLPGFVLSLPELFARADRMGRGT